MAEAKITEAEWQSVKSGVYNANSLNQSLRAEVAELSHQVSNQTSYINQLETLVNSLSNELRDKNII